MEQHGRYKFEIGYDVKFGWMYIIYGKGHSIRDDWTIESTDFFDTEQEARFAAIGHIALLEDGED